MADTTLAPDGRPDDPDEEVILEDHGPATPEVDPHTESDPKPVDE